ncbi:hypothetical protein ZWY2020_046797 [Hordeum vulgare]|nr:hypothetical protein ZWY2020_046797 [Hordeum vulgare]
MAPQARCLGMAVKGSSSARRSQRQGRQEAEGHQGAKEKKEKARRTRWRTRCFHRVDSGDASKRCTDSLVGLTFSLEAFSGASTGPGTAGPVPCSSAVPCSPFLV